MPFPVSEKVIYRRPVLAEAICQLRFPPILRVQTEIPTRFQESVRDRFPIYQVEQPSVQSPFLSENVQVTLPMTRNHRFATEDGGLVATLASDFIALTANKQSYHRFADFRSSLEVLVETLQREYQPNFYTRIGLRYQNLIQREEIGLDEDVHWSELLQPHIAGELGREELRGRVHGRVGELFVRLRAGDGIEEGEGRNSFLKLRHGLVPVGGKKEPAYLIDIDVFFEGRTDTPNVFDKLEGFNDRAARAFRWCISDVLHNSLEPEPV